MCMQVVRTQDLQSYQFSNLQHSIVNQNHHAVHYIPRTHSSYNQKFLLKARLKSKVNAFHYTNFEKYFKIY